MRRTDANGNRWHLLTGVSQSGELIEALAASCFDGIGVIVRWTKTGDQWRTEAMDTEGCSWSPVDFSEEGNEIPPEPPRAWDDRPQASNEAHGWSFLDTKFYVRYKSRIPDPGVCRVMGIDWRHRRLDLSNGSFCYVADFDDVEKVDAIAGDGEGGEG